MADAWLHQNASISVDVQSVADFARQLQAEISENFLPSVTEGIQPMLSVPAPFGAGGVFGEAALLRDMHERNRQAAARLLNDVTRSLNALSQAAAAVAASYAGGDAEAAATTEDVYAAFTPTEVSPTTAAPATVPTGLPTGPTSVTDHPGGHSGSSPDHQPTVSPGAGVVIADGTAGEYTIPADDEGMWACTPTTPQPTN